MAKKELTIEEKLEALYQLQKIDSQIDKIEVVKGELPMEVQDLEDELEGLNKRLQTIENEAKALENEVQTRLKTKEEAKMLIIKYEKQQANVKNNREFDALSKEIELQNLEIQLSDKKVKEFKEKQEGQAKYIQEAKNLIASKTAELSDKKVELSRIIEETDHDLEKLKVDSEKSSKEVDERLLGAYNRIRKAYRNSLAVVSIDRDSCGGCYAKIPPQKQMEIKLRKKVLVCEHCGRIFVYPYEMEESDKAAREAADAEPKTKVRSRRAKANPTLEDM